MAHETFDLHNVPVFATGVWNNDTYTEADLDHMVAAFGQVGFQPPIKLGHDESQPLAKSDGMPAIGWVANVRRMGQQLVADIKALPRKVYDAIRRKNYDRVSAEVYWDYEANGRKWPRVLKALALLGADVPAVTSLAGLEQLYDSEGRQFKRYDMGVMPMPAMPPTGFAEEHAPPKKAKPDVGYTEAGEGGLERCGACKYFGGGIDPTGEHVMVGNCALVEGEVASSWVCDLWDPREAFQAEYATAHGYIIRKRGSKWVLVSRTDPSKVLGEHDTQEGAEAQERAIQASKARRGSVEGEVKEVRLTVEQMADLCPSCADQMRAKGLKEVKFADRRELVERIYQNDPDRICGGLWFNGTESQREAFGDGSEGRGRDEKPPKAWWDGCIEKVSQPKESKKTQEGTTKTIASKDAGRKGRTYMAGMAVEEKDGEFCVMKDGEKMKCFPTREEADAYQTSLMSEQAAQVKTLEFELANAKKTNESLTAQIAGYDGQIKTLTDRLSVIEQRATQAETERAKALDDGRRARNASWVKEHTAEGNLKILPVERPYVEWLLDWVTGGQAKTYAAQEGVELTPEQVVKRLYEQRKPGTFIFEEISVGKGTETGGQGAKVVEFASIAEAREEATRLAKVYQEEKGEKSFRAAYKAVLAKDPELKAAVAGTTPEGERKAQDGAGSMQQLFKR